jgi:hypothetical protein
MEKEKSKFWSKVGSFFKKIWNWLGDWGITILIGAIFLVSILFILKVIPFPI